MESKKYTGTETCILIALIALSSGFSFALSRKPRIIDTKSVYALGFPTLASNFRIVVSVILCFYIVTTEMTIRFELYYFTHMCYLLSAFFFILLATCDPKNYVNNSFRDRKMKLIYVLYVLIFSGSVVSTINYWVFIAKGTAYANNIWKVMWYGGNPHGLVLSLLVIDMIFFNRIPIYYSSVCYLTVFCFFYMGFHLLFHYFNNWWIYPFMDPFTPFGHVVSFSIPIVPYIIHSVPWALSALRDFVLGKFESRMSKRSGSEKENGVLANENELGKKGGEIEGKSIIRENGVGLEDANSERDRDGVVKKKKNRGRRGYFDGGIEHGGSDADSSNADCGDAYSSRSNSHGDDCNSNNLSHRNEEDVVEMFQTGAN